MQIDYKKFVLVLSVLVIFLSCMLIASSRSATKIAPESQISTANNVAEDDETNSIFTAEGTHEIGKSVIHDDTRWIEMRAGVNKDDSSTEYYRGLYELWRAHESESPTLVTTLSLSNFSKLDWDINEEGGITVFHWDGGPEGGTSTEIIYDAQGEERARVTQENLPADGDTFTFGVNPTYTVHYLLNEDCNGMQTKETLTKNVELQGISIGYGNDNNHDYQMTTPVFIECATYDSTFINPTIKIVSFDETSVNVQLADDTTVTITKGVPPEVVFQ